MTNTRVRSLASDARTKAAWNIFYEKKTGGNKHRSCSTDPLEAQAPDCRVTWSFTSCCVVDSVSVKQRAPLLLQDYQNLQRFAPERWRQPRTKTQQIFPATAVCPLFFLSTADLQQYIDQRESFRWKEGQADGKRRKTDTYNMRARAWTVFGRNPKTERHLPPSTSAQTATLQPYHSILP